jgi:hypothetical protein
MCGIKACHNTDRLCDACIVNQNVHAAKIFDDLSRHAFALIFFGHVAHVTTMPLSNRGCDLRRGLTFQIQNSHGSSVLGKKLRCGQSNSLWGRRTRDDGYSILQ